LEPAATGAAGNGVFEAVVAIAAAEAFGARIAVDVTEVGVSGEMCIGCGLAVLFTRSAKSFSDRNLGSDVAEGSTNREAAPVFCDAGGESASGGGDPLCTRKCGLGANRSPQWINDSPS